MHMTNFKTAIILSAFFHLAAIFADEQPIASFSTLIDIIEKSESSSKRIDAADKILENYPDKLTEFRKILIKKRADQESGYTEKLESFLKNEYLQRLNKLSEEEVRFIVQLKILWEPYLKYRGNRIEFKERYIKPLQKVKNLLMTQVRQIEDTEIKSLRKELLVTAAILRKCEDKLEIPKDPTVNIKTPTGITYTSLDTPQSYEDYLHLLERTLVLMNSVANQEADRLLMMNVENSKILDVYEAEFTFFANEVRMMMGTIAWVADPLLSNCARDHSHDRKNGKASGHSSTIPGKKSFVDRARRMGTHAMSEGAGGGKTGIDAIMGLSYGGGHTGPLYSTLRNVVGVGVRHGACTAMYRGDGNLKHTAPAIDNFNFMPPGLSYKELKSQSSLSSLYKRLQKGEFSKVLTQLKNFKPMKSMDSVYAVWFKSYAELKMKSQVKEVEELLEAGDAFLATEKYEELRKKFSGNDLFDELTTELKKQFTENEIRNEYRAGKAFYKYAKSDRLNEKSMERFIKSNEGSIYAEMAQAVIDNFKKPERGFHYFKFFLKKNKALYDYGYPECLKEM